MPNRLIHQTSPYLLQHAHNPVDWHPWGPEAFEAARQQNKPIFLSVGYSACYWCHVMERQCFEVASIAELMNRGFINIKVDREERPDVDQLYMLAVQILTRQGGWPMSVFLTPSLKPFFGGTYFPPQDMHGRPGFSRVLESIEAAWKSRREEVERSADEIVRLVSTVSLPPGPKREIRVDRQWIGGLVERSVADYDQCYGGFSGAPKFPRQTLLEFLLAADSGHLADGLNPPLRQMLRHTLGAMADGGICDHLGGGFHRYSTDEKWLVPHFEIMLYDNAMLAVCYVEAARLTGEGRYARVARGILDFTLREMTGPHGAFYTAFDAEVDAREGLSYLWTLEEVQEVLSGAQFAKDDIELFGRVYGLNDGPNFEDPHHGPGFPDHNILFLPVPLVDLAQTMQISEEQLDARLAPMRAALYARRRTRKQPLLDTKILTSWNGLMIRAMAIAGRALDEPRYVDAAIAAADYILDHHHMADGTLHRTSRPDAASAVPQAPIPGTLDDYAFFAQALLAIAAATSDDRWRQRATRVLMAIENYFSDPGRAGFFFTPSEATDLIVRQKFATDSPLPSANAVAARCFLDIGQTDQALGIVATFAQTLEDQAESASAMLLAALQLLDHHDHFIVGGQRPPQEAQRPLSPEKAAHQAVTITPRFLSASELEIQLDIAAPFHLNAHDVEEPLLGTMAAITLPPSLNTTATIEFPPGEMRSFPFADKPIGIYQERVTILARFDKPLPPNTTIKVSLGYQPCTDEACLTPIEKQVFVRSPVSRS